jgi:tetratricopeptide (TPR) repeat protein
MAEKAAQDAFIADDKAFASFFTYKLDGEHKMTEGSFAEAIRLFNKALSILDKFRMRRSTQSASLLTNLALSSLKVGKVDDAERLNREAMSVLEEELERKPDKIGRVNLGALWNNLGRVMQVKGRLGEAEEYLRRAVAIGEEMAIRGGFTVTEEVHHASFSLSTSYHNFADVLSRLDKDEEAVFYFVRSLEIRRAILPAGHEQIAQVLNNLGNICRKLKMYAEVEALYRELLSFPGHSGETTASYYAILGENGIYLGKGPASSLELFKKALAIQVACQPANHPDIAVTHQNIKTCQGLLEKEQEQPSSGAGAGLSEEMRAKLLAELIDEDKDKDKTSKKKGKKGKH